VSQLGNFGLYRGVVTGTNDPTSLGRIRVSVPRFFGTASVWSFPCLPTPTSEIPEVSIGTGVWIQFEGGDLQYPVYVGFFGKAS